MASFPLVLACPTLRDGTPWSPEYGDIYHSASGGLDQARHVFLAGTDLQQRWGGRDFFTVLEVGFGLGLNFLATWQAWQASPHRSKRLHFVSIEKNPVAAPDLARFLSPYPELARLTGELVATWPLLVPGCHRLHFDQGAVTLTLVFADARDLNKLKLQADAVFLDGFSPAKNPEMWNEAVIAALTRNLAPDAWLATWSVAGELRKCLESAGFVVEKRPGFGGKREMLTAKRSAMQNPRRAHVSSVAVIGAGLAGTSLAQRLAERGMHITLFETHRSIAQGASGNPVGIFRPLFSRDDNPASRFSRAAFCYGMHHWDRLAMIGHNPRWLSCGVVQIARDEAESQRWNETLVDYPVNYIRSLDRGEIQELTGIAAPQNGCHVPLGGWISPPSLCAAQLATQGKQITTCLGATVTNLKRATSGWQLSLHNHAAPLDFDAVVLANANHAVEFAPRLSLQPVRGQLTYLPEGAIPSLAQVIAREGYVTPAVDGLHILGATYEFDATSICPSSTAHASNLRRLDGLLPGWGKQFAPATLTGRASFRATTSDRLPVIGEVEPGLYVFTGLGSRGIVWSALGAELLTCLITGEPLPVESDLVAAVSPTRFPNRSHD
ncbi:MAG: FAD-dependent 5-carboxymethylaminomethyl-2-thiouridine(34) oxidoreductase MnmC [Thiobacillaceae bacterium]